MKAQLRSDGAGEATTRQGPVSSGGAGRRRTSRRASMAFCSAAFSSFAARARRGGVVCEARPSRPTNQPTRAERRKFACTMHYMQPKKDQSAPGTFFMKKMGLVGWVTNYASPGLTVLRERPAPAPAQAGTRSRI